MKRSTDVKAAPGRRVAKMGDKKDVVLISSSSSRVLRVS